MNKLLAFVDLFRRGSAVADPDLWKNRAGAVAAVAGLISALVQIARLYGYDLPLDADGILALAGGIVTLVCLFVSYGTSPNTGVLPPKPAPDQPAVERDPIADQDLRGGP
jgi:energy-converting hydrogenase Eha subunit F